jgi:hypothetical protein
MRQEQRRSKEGLVKNKTWYKLVTFPLSRSSRGAQLEISQHPIQGLFVSPLSRVEGGLFETRNAL